MYGTLRKGITYSVTGCSTEPLVSVKRDGGTPSPGTRRIAVSRAGLGCAAPDWAAALV